MSDIISVGKPAQQSSVSIWSSSQNSAIDAGLAVNGQAGTSRFFHTDIEDEAWWQVDLGAEFAVTEVRIFNRMDAAGRLGWFSVLISLSGAPNTWVPVQINRDLAFNVGNVSPVAVRPAHAMLGRFVRIQKSEPGFLHLCQCEVLGYVPDAAEHARLLADEILLRDEFSGYQLAIDRLRHGRDKAAGALTHQPTPCAPWADPGQSGPSAAAPPAPPIARLPRPDRIAPAGPAL
jgi:hypothetical protein